MASNGEVAVRCTGVAKRYGSVVAVDGVDLEVRRGECFGLLGPNGAGKTTTVEILEGLIEPDAGDVEVLGRRWDENERELRERIGVSLQETRLAEKLTVAETLRLFRSFYRSGRDVDELLETVQLVGKRDARVRELSGGQRQRLAVACGLAGEPELLFLDEPTTGLDPQSRRSLWEVIERFLAGGGTVLLTTHYMEEAAHLSHRIAIMDRGQVIARGTPAGLVASLGAEHVVEFSLRDGSALDPASLAHLPGVTGAHAREEALVLTVREVHGAIPALLSELERRGVALSDLRTRHATLEDVFLELTGRSLRDA
ncbi:MAG TPA: ABC transporter ATP-binding protein [Longimicrobiales bacterium]|nr:ABC transporter ATP-binding protein [Longimicrobiales bacterium]